MKKVVLITIRTSNQLSYLQRIVEAENVIFVTFLHIQHIPLTRLFFMKFLCMERGVGSNGICNCSSVQL